MRYHVLASDYDSTLATRGRVPGPVLDALRSLRASGRRLILITGRVLDELLDLMPAADLFDRIVAENGGLLYRPGTRETRLLAEAPPPSLVDRLARSGVVPVHSGRVIVATLRRHEEAVSAAIRELGLSLHLVFNRDSLMILPSGVSKASGLEAAVAELRLAPGSVVGVGDAENDHAFLDLCGCSVAVRNALPALRSGADWVTDGEEGDGVVELVDRLIRTDLEDVRPREA